MTPEIKLGQKVRDKLTGFTGIATARLQYINRCEQVLVSLPVDKEGKHVESVWIDAPRLEVTDPNIAEIFPRPAAPGPG